MRLFLLSILLLSTNFLQAQSGLNGLFTATVDGLFCQLNLTSSGAKINGTYEEGQLHLQLKGTTSGKQASGELYDPNSGQAVATFQMNLREANTLDLTFSAQGQSTSHPFIRSTANSAPVAAPAGQLDNKLIGNWNHQIITNSGNAGFSTVLYFQIGGDGRYAQYSKAVGGGTEWSYNSGKAQLQQQGRWYSRDNILYIQPEGQADFTAAAKYRFHESRLVTEDVNGRKIWSRD